MKFMLNKISGPHYLLIASILAVGLVFANANITHAGDPDGVIGGWNIDNLECLETVNEDGTEKKEWEVIDLSEELQKIKDESVGNLEEDIAKLKTACHKLTREEVFRPIAYTKIEGKVFEFHPVDPTNPAESEWFAAPSQDVPVIATGIGFQIFWVSEPDGFFYFYKTRFGEGPIVLNLRLPEDAHPINPNILIESTGKDEVWTVFLGFYRGDIPPPNIDQLKTPNGNFLPFANTKFDGLIGIDTDLLPSVGGVLPQPPSLPVVALAALMLIVLPIAGVFQLRRSQSMR